MEFTPWFTPLRMELAYSISDLRWHAESQSFTEQSKQVLENIWTNIGQ